MVWAMGSMPRVLFLADQFSDATRTRRERHPGGAELTDAAALAACPWPVTTRKLSQLTPGEAVSYDVVVVANSQSASAAQLAEIAATGRHVAFEHDLRVCLWRGNFPRSADPAHRRRQRCWCPHLGARDFFATARGVIFLTELQERVYRNNPFFACGASRVLGSSLFDLASLERTMTDSRGARHGTCVFASPHLIKGFAAAQRYCYEAGLQTNLIEGMSPPEVLSLFARSERFVYLPIGPEWAGRMVVEARLLGCEVVLNDNVGVAGESFWQGSSAQALEFIADGPKRFWRLVEELLAAPPRAVANAGTPGPAALAATAFLAAARALPRWFMPLDAPSPAPRTFPAW